MGAEENQAPRDGNRNAVAGDLSCKPSAKPTPQSLRKKLTMETCLERNLYKCDPQARSPLWRTLPSEIRYMIFEFATAQYEDVSRAYPKHVDWYRPDHRGPWKSCTNILLTCRRAWLEANTLPMRQAVQLFWIDHQAYAPDHYHIAARWWQHMSSRLTRLNLENVRHMHFMIKLHDPHGFEKGNSIRKVVKNLKPQTIKITNRLCDWPDHEWRYRECGLVMWEKLMTQHLNVWLDAASVCVEKFELALEIFDSESEWEQYAPFFDDIRGLSKKIGIARSTRSNQQFETYLAVAEEPRVWNWRRRLRADRDTGIADPNGPNLACRVFELQWTHVRYAIDLPADGGQARKPANTAAPKNRIPLREIPSHQHHRLHAYLDDPSPFLRQHNRLRRHAQELSKVTEARCRRRFRELFTEMEIGTEVQRLREQMSLLRVED